MNGFFRSDALSDRKDYYLYVGQLIPYKRPDLALEACLRLGRKLVLVGDGECRAALEKRCAGNPDIVFAGLATGKTLRRYYAEARALIFPGVEDFGIVPLEARSAGNAGDRLGARSPRNVRAGETGLFLPQPEVDRSASVRYLRERMGPSDCTAFEKSMQRFTAMNFGFCRGRTSYRTDASGSHFQEI